MLSFPLHCQKQERIFLQYLLWEFVQEPRDKSHSIVGILLGLRLFILRLVGSKPPAIYQYSSGLFPPQILFINIFSGKPKLPIFASLSPVLRQ